MKTTRNNAIQTAKDWVKEWPLILDTETTGLNNDYVIVELSIINIDGDVLFNHLIKPNKSIPEEVTRIHHITNEMVEGCQKLSNYWGPLSDIMSNRTILSYNIGFDHRMIQQSLDLVGTFYPLEMKQHHCIMALYAKYYGEWDRYNRSYRWQKLDNAIQQCGLTPCANAHRALSDAEMARRLLLLMADTKPEVEHA